MLQQGHSRPLFATIITMESTITATQQQEAATYSNIKSQVAESNPNFRSSSSSSSSSSFLSSRPFIGTRSCSNNDDPTISHTHHSNNSNNYYYYKNNPIKMKNNKPLRVLESSSLQSATSPSLINNVVLPTNHPYDLHELVDNTSLVYIALRLQHSKVPVRVRPEILTECPEILIELDIDLCQCLQEEHILPRSVHGLVRRTKLWINHTYIYGPQKAPIVLNHSTAHHHPEWLQWCVCHVFNVSCVCACNYRWRWCKIYIHCLYGETKL